MSDKFQPPSEDLPPVGDLIAIATVTEDDAKLASEKWKDKPPDEQFTNLLDATAEEELS